MATEGSRKKLKTIDLTTTTYREKLISTSTISAKTNTVATRILLDDAHNGFKNGNFVCLPFSLETVLGMLAAGAQGKTLEQLLEFLGHETIDQLLSESPSAKLLAQLLSNSNGGGLDIGLANEIWVDKNLFNRVQPCYKEVLKSVYKTKARFVDFTNKPDKSAEKINSWVNKKTRGVIPTIVNVGDLEGVVIALANALYFKGLWFEPFDTEFTEEKDFHLMNGETVLVPFMTSYKDFDYGSFEGCQILKNPYESSEGQSNKFSMYIFLPDRKDGLKELLQLFHSDPALFHTKFYLDFTEFNELRIPKFTISSKFEPRDAMEQMGLTLPFQPKNMELNRILESRNPGDGMLYVSKILQKSFIEVDEKGTDAAACSSLMFEVEECCQEDTPLPLKPRLSQELYLMIDARNGFKNGNFVCSPFSLETLLGMLAAGADGKTLKQLLKFLGHETIDQLLFESPSAKLLAQLLSNSKSSDTGDSLDIGLANAIWVDKKLNGQVQSSYKESLKTVYNAKLKFLDFTHKPGESAEKINSWVYKKTRGLIPNIVDAGDLDGVVIALANALYFKGLWSEPFNTKYTEEKDFHLMNGETVSVPFMSRFKGFNYGSFGGCQILKIPYESEGQSNKFSMYIFLPDRKDGLRELLQVFHSDPALFHTRFYLDWTRFDELWIPKFKISNEFELKDAMKQMGLTLPFQPMNMELNKILESRNPGDGMLYVSKILQKSFIEVDEKGTEAAACSFMSVEIGACAQRTPPPPKPRFVADHLFMFMIREDTSLVVFFIGVVLNPNTMDLGLHQKYHEVKIGVSAFYAYASRDGSNFLSFFGIVDKVFSRVSDFRNWLRFFQPSCNLRR
uniref:uncharacterized protein LOC122587951 n=1 Tax=Erigeron canadensis TaxID=72917 RepID=UPI001CB96AA3|nr:uncharacterized protein LOC122587951 [Erigeron canadensis]